MAAVGFCEAIVALYCACLFQPAAANRILLVLTRKYAQLRNTYERILVVLNPTPETTEKSASYVSLVHLNYRQL